MYIGISDQLWMCIKQLILIERKTRIGTDNTINTLDTWVSLNTLDIEIEIIDICFCEHISLRPHSQQNRCGLTIAKTLRQQIIRLTRWYICWQNRCIRS